MLRIMLHALVSQISLLSIMTMFTVIAFACHDRLVMVIRLRSWDMRQGNWKFRAWPLKLKHFRSDQILPIIYIPANLG